jgi:hypothetical protein
MKKLAYLFMAAAFVAVFACNKDDKSERFKLLTSPTWKSDSLLANGIDASGPGGILVKFKGDAKFEEDGTGTFGGYTGQWRFNTDETDITIITDSLPLPIISKIKELTSNSLKITTTISLPVNPTVPINIRMTFKAK